MPAADDQEWGMVERDAELLQSYLAARDTPCPACSYNLRDLRSSRCPECNQDLTLRVGLAEPAIGAFVVSLVGLAVGAGAPLLMVAGVVIISIVEKGFPRNDEFIFLVVYPLVAGLIAATALHWLAGARGRRWFLARPPAGRRAVAWEAWVYTLGMFGLWLFSVLTLL